MDYVKMSDFDMAEAVLMAMDAKKINSDDDVSMYLLGKEKERKDVGPGASKQFAFDPCNNPADAWPIISDNGISIRWNWNDDGLHGAMADPLYEYEHENVLRAAMIVFLKMQETV